MHGCSKDSGNNTLQKTELEGLWTGTCIKRIDGFTSQADNAPASSNLLREYKGNNIKFTYNTYTDTTCSILETSNDVSLNLNLSGPDGLPVTFIIGDEITSANGVAVKEIDYITENNIAEKSIFLLQNNNTMFLALPCKFSPATCLNDRQTEISYLNEYTKIN